MATSEIVIWTILILTGISTYLALKDSSIFERYNLNPKAVLNAKQYDRLLSSGFLHADWMHFAINMYLLFMLASQVILITGVFGFMVLYFISMLISSYLGVYIHRNEPYYRAVGASGAVMAVLFAYIIISPNSTFLFFFIIPMPGYVLGILYVAYSIYGIESKGKDQIARSVWQSANIEPGIGTMLGALSYG